MNKISSNIKTGINSRSWRGPRHLLVKLWEVTIPNEVIGSNHENPRRYTVPVNLVCREETMEEAIRIDAGHTKAWKLYENGTLTLEINPPSGMALKKAYAFDMCFDETSSNETVYLKTAQDIVRDTATGINGCYMAYGQTGCGKTHSIMGTSSDPGILPRALADLFDIIENNTAADEDNDIVEQAYLLRVSYIEIYLEKVNDLFQDGPKGESHPLENLDVKEHPKGGFYVVGLAERQVTKIEEVMALLQKAEMKRHFASTNFNETSSRSHTVFTTILESTTTYADGSTISKTGELKLVDLAGNEKASAAEGQEGAKDRLAEGQAINKSLFLLSEVIAKLSKRAEAMKKGPAGSTAAERARKEMLHIPWRDSKLTRLLQNALGGNSRAALLVAVHPSTQSLEISLSTLRFALKTKQIKKKIQQNFVSPEQSLIMQQKEQIKLLQAQLDAIQKLTGAEIPQELRAPANEGMGTQRVPHMPPPKKNGESTEAIDKLKVELQTKVDNLSKLILTQKRPEESPGPKKAGFTRSVTLAGITGRLERQSTVGKPTRLRLYGDLPESKRDTSQTQIKAIAATLEYLKNIDEMNEVDKRPHGELEGTTEGPIKEQARIDIRRYDTVHLENALERATQPDNRLERSVVALKVDNKRLSKERGMLQAQVCHVRALLQKLGLSMLVTGTEAATSAPDSTVQLLHPLGAADGQGMAPEGDLVDFVGKVQPMAYSGIMSILWLVETKGFILSFPAMSLFKTMPRSHAGILSLFAQIICSKNGVVDRHVGLGPEEKDLAAIKADSIFALLAPWEQYILMLFFEHQETKNQLENLALKFDETVAEMKRKITNVLADKLELLEHSAKVIEELRFFRYEVVPHSEPKISEKFTDVLTRLENLSKELGERSIEVVDLQAALDHAENERDHFKIKYLELRSRLNATGLQALPEDLAHWGKENAPEEQKDMVRQLLLSQKIIADFRMRLDESSAFREDLRRVNEQLGLELRTAQAAVEEEKKLTKLLRVELSNERLTMERRLILAQKRFQEAYDTHKEAERKIARLEARINELESEQRRDLPMFDAEAAQLTEKEGSSINLLPSALTTTTTVPHGKSLPKRGYLPNRQLKLSLPKATKLPRSPINARSRPGLGSIKPNFINLSKTQPPQVNVIEPQTKDLAGEQTLSRMQSKDNAGRDSMPSTTKQTIVPPLRLLPKPRLKSRSPLPKSLRR